MSLIICPECGVHVSDKATLCPNCGYPNPGGEPNVKTENVTLETSEKEQTQIEQQSEEKIEIKPSVSETQYTEPQKEEETSFENKDYKYQYKPRKSSNKACCWIVIIVVFLFIVTLVAIVIFAGNSIKKQIDNVNDDNELIEQQYDPDYFDRDTHNDDYPMDEDEDDGEVYVDDDNGLKDDALDEESSSSYQSPKIDKDISSTHSEAQTFSSTPSTSSSQDDSNIESDFQ